MPSLDFIRALNERHWVVKLLFRIVVGRYAYREFLFMVRIIEEQGMGAFHEYGLRGHDYHRDPQPWSWWL